MLLLSLLLPLAVTIKSCLQALRNRLLLGVIKVSEREEGGDKEGEYVADLAVTGLHWNQPTVKQQQYQWKSSQHLAGQTWHVEWKLGLGEPRDRHFQTRSEKWVSTESLQKNWLQENECNRGYLQYLRDTICNQDTNLKLQKGGDYLHLNYTYHLRRTRIDNRLADSAEYCAQACIAWSAQSWVHTL